MPAGSLYSKGTNPPRPGGALADWCGAVTRFCPERPAPDPRRGSAVTARETCFADSATSSARMEDGTHPISRRTACPGQILSVTNDQSLQEPLVAEPRPGSESNRALSHSS